MTTISVTTAAALAGVDRRTVRRWMGEGDINLDALLAHVGLDLDAEDRAVVLMADAGDADACADVGLALLERELHERAVYWLQRAADQGHADAMQHLGACLVAGRGTAADQYLGMMWIARAAAAGHQIAKGQMDAVMAGRR